MVYVPDCMKFLGIRLGIVGVACCLAGTMAMTQGQAPPLAGSSVDNRSGTSSGLTGTASATM